CEDEAHQDDVATITGRRRRHPPRSTRARQERDRPRREAQRVRPRRADARRRGGRTPAGSSRAGRRRLAGAAAHLPASPPRCATELLWLLGAILPWPIGAMAARSPQAVNRSAWNSAGLKLRWRRCAPFRRRVSRTGGLDERPHLDRDGLADE